MPDADEQLVASGAIGSLKRDVLLEASYDVYFLAHIRKWFVEEAGSEAAMVASEYTARVARELIDGGLCNLATWSGGGQPEITSRSPAELLVIARRYESPRIDPFDYFLVATKSGKEWIEKYRRLIAEL